MATFEPEGLWYYKVTTMIREKANRGVPVSEHAYAWWRGYRNVVDGGARYRAGDRVTYHAIHGRKVKAKVVRVKDDQWGRPVVLDLYVTGTNGPYVRGETLPDMSASWVDLRQAV